MEYLYGYDAYQSTSDPSLYHSPGMSSTSPQSLYPGICSSTKLASQFHCGHASPATWALSWLWCSVTSSEFTVLLHLASGHDVPTTHSPMMMTQLGTSNPATLANKKHEFQVFQRISLGTSLNLTILLYSTIFSSKLPLRISCTRPCSLHHRHIRLSPLLLTVDPKYWWCYLEVPCTATICKWCMPISKGCTLVTTMMELSLLWRSSVLYWTNSMLTRLISGNYEWVPHIPIQWHPLMDGYDHRTYLATLLSLVETNTDLASSSRS